MKNFYIAKGLFTCGGSAISLFLPLYLYQHLPLWEVFAFFAGNNIVHAFMMRPAVMATARFGIVRMFSIGIALYAAFYATIRFTPLSLTSMAMLAVFYGCSNACYWTGYHLFLASRASDSTSGTQLGYLKNISGVASIAGPAIGAVVISTWGFAAMFGVAAILMATSLLSLIKEPPLLLDRSPNWREIYSGRGLGEGVALSVGFGAEDSAQGIVWPLFMVVSGFMGVKWLGATYSLVFVAMMLITHAIGWAVDRHQSAVLIVGAIGMMVMNLLRCGGVMSAGTSVLATLGSEALNGAANVPVDAICYQRARASNIAGYIMFRETMINLGSAVFFTIGALTGSFQVLFFFAAFGSLSYVLFLKSDLLRMNQ